MKLGLVSKVVVVVGVWVLLFATVVAAAPVSAQDQQSAAQRCFEHHRFGAQPADVAKTADGQTVLAQVSWGYHDSIGCFLTLDDAALAALQAAPAPQSLPNAPTDASRRCFKHHKFGENPVDVAKTADGQTVLARLSWDYHDSIGCYLVLDDTALSTLQDTDANDTLDTDPPPAGPQFTPVAISEAHSCAIRTDQTIACWGSNRFGRIDAPPGQYTAIATGNSHSCAIRTNQTITCWSGKYDRFYGKTDAPAGQFTAIAAGSYHSCSIKSDQTITCWGANDRDQADAPPGQYTAIATGNSHSCAIRTNQTITCWGDNRYGKAAAPPGQYTAIAAGNSHSCAIRTDQTITCWGNDHGNLADAPPGQYAAIATGNSHSCAIRTNQTITCWGDNRYGKTAAPPGQYTAIATGNFHSCAIRTDQAITCWGNDQYGQSSVPVRLGTPPEELLLVEVFSESEPAVKVGRSFEVTVEFNRAVNGFDADDMNVVNGDIARFSGSGSKYEATVTAAALGTVVVLIPRAAALDQDGRSNEPSQPFARTVRTVASNAIAIATGGDHSCAIRTDQTISCWGRNSNSQTDAPRGQFTAIATGGVHSCAIRTDQTITCWGRNSNSQTDAPRGQFTAIATGSAFSCAIRTDQTITCWGDNWYGKADAPRGQFTAIATGGNHSCAIRTDQTITCWGNNYKGQTDAPPGQFTTIATGRDHSCAIRTDGTAQCWGNNEYGESNGPPGQFTAIATGQTNSCAIGTDQTITCWGNNFNGQTDAPPGQFTTIATGGNHSCAIRSDQTIICWGANGYGESDGPRSQFTVITPRGHSFGSHSCGIRIDLTIACWTQDGGGQPAVPPGRFTVFTFDEELFDTWDRDAVRASAFAEFNRKEPEHGWTGDIDGCVAGMTSQQYRDSIFQRVNWYRQMAGVNPVVENLTHSTTAQHTALIMAAQGRLSHLVPDDWACFTRAGEVGAASSSLGLGHAGIEGIDSYMQDAGNIGVGHRRSMLQPMAVEFGTGNIPPVSNALYESLESKQGPRKTREERGFVAWPPPGYVPPAVNWGLWSFDLSGVPQPADVSTAAVEVSDEYGPLEVELLYRHSTGIVWGMHGNAGSGLLIGRRPLYSLADSNYCYTVKVSGVKINGLVQTPYEYAVCILTR